MMRVANLSTLAGCAFWLLAGCGAYDDIKSQFEDDKPSQPTVGIPTDPTPNPIPAPAPTPPVEEPPPDPSPAPPPVDEPPSPDFVPPDFHGVHWLHTDVSDWAETSSLSVSLSGGFIRLDYDKANIWPCVNGTNANPWVFVFQDGVWYAGTFEWLRCGQTSKPADTVDGAHIKKAPLQDWRPRSGEVLGFMVSGLARDNHTRNVSERTSVVMFRWP